MRERPGLIDGIPVLSADEFGVEFDSMIKSSRIPILVHFELTYRCNFDCVHCFVVQPSAHGELSTQEVKETLDQLAELGTLYLTLSGGEVLTRPDFEEIWIHAKTLGFMITLFTNGAMLKERFLKLFEEYPPSRFEITIYGADEDTYQAVTRRKNMHGLVFAAIDRLLAAGVKVILKAIAINLNVADIDAIRAEVVKRGCGEDFRFDAQIVRRLDCKRGPEEYRISADEVVASDRNEESRAADFRRLYERSKALGPPGDRLFRCNAGKIELTIDPFGKVTTCVLYRQQSADLRTQRLREVWEETIPAIVGQRVTRATRCRTCDKVALCASCTGSNALETGDPEEPSDYHCEITHARVRAFCADLEPKLPQPSGAILPLYRRQDCKRPWLHSYRPVPSWFRVPERRARRPGRSLPLVRA
jgi:radical SAM protein with 4Fe4S-binding SPASM domain